MSSQIATKRKTLISLPITDLKKHTEDLILPVIQGLEWVVDFDLEWLAQNSQVLLAYQEEMQFVNGENDVVRLFASLVLYPSNKRQEQKGQKYVISVIQSGINGNVELKRGTQEDEGSTPSSFLGMVTEMEKDDLDC